MKTNSEARAISRWMRAHAEEHRDSLTDELNLTSLVEAWDYANGDSGCTLDPDHIAWTVAAELN
jgi:hypothetical protein